MTTTLSVGTLDLPIAIVPVTYIALRDIYDVMFLADRPQYGRAYASVASVCRRRLSVRNVLWLNGASQRAKVTIDSLQEVVFEKQIGTKMNDLDLCLEVVSKSCQPLRYIRR